MQPYNITIPIYAETEAEADMFRQDFYHFVDDKQKQGIAVTAKKLSQALAMFKDNPYLNHFLKL